MPHISLPDAINHRSWLIGFYGVICRGDDVTSWLKYYACLRILSHLQSINGHFYWGDEPQTYPVERLRRSSCADIPFAGSRDAMPSTLGPRRQTVLMSRT